MSRKLLGCTFGVALAALSLSVAGAQDAVLSQFYGNGVHAYFAGNYSKAREELTTAINSGSKDPRAYYFRALANLKYGLQDEAKTDFERGSALETGDASRNYPVSKSLERVQGADRLTLERYRSVARASAVARQERRMQARYEALRRSEGDKLRRVARPRIEQAQPATAIEAVRSAPAAASMPKAAAKAGVEAAGDDPFATDTVPAAPSDTPMGSDPADPANPFGDAAVEGAGEAPAADADPFGGADAAPATAPAPAVVPMPDADASDPFGAAPPAEAPAAEAGAGEPAPPAAADPFADDAAMTEEKPADAKPDDAAPKSEESDNPFGS